MSPSDDPCVIPNKLSTVSSGKARDPVSGISIPPREASNSVKLSSMREHVEWAKSHARELLSCKFQDPQVKDISEKVSSMCTNDLIAARRKEVKYIRRMSKLLRADSDRRLSSLEPHIQRVLKAGKKYPLHISLLEHLLERYQVPGRRRLLQDLINGFDFVGDILVDETIGPAEKAVREFLVSEEELIARASKISNKLTRMGPSKALSEEDVDEIFQQTAEEISLGRMQEFEEVDIQPNYPPTRRFAVKQLSSKGKTKLRPIDDYLSSEINGLSRVGKRISVGKIDTMLSSMKLMKKNNPKRKLVIIKSDFKSAYRSCPIKKEHLDWTKIVVWDPKGKRYRQTRHFCMPFGAVSAVYAWHRVGQALTTILSTALSIPFSRYVDDIFAAIPEEGSTEARNFCLEIIETLGFTLEKEKTPIPGPSSVVLGVQLTIEEREMRGKGSSVLEVTIDKTKADHWRSKLRDIKARGFNTAKEAESIAGRANFISQMILGPAGASRVRAIYQAVYQSDRSTLQGELLQEVNWWEDYLSTRKPVTIRLNDSSGPVTIIYSDAEGTGGIGGLIVPEHQGIQWFRTHVSSVSRKDYLQPRKVQIIPYESIAARESLHRWKTIAAGKDVIMFIDNHSIYHALRKGRSKAPDINLIVRDILDIAAKHDIRIFPYWVPSSLNISDLPSRGEDPRVGREVFILR